jgi:hypothetical protein|nr:hypothetical protein [Phenylobacterium sp.]
MERVTSSALRDVLEKVGPAIAAGGANVISVEAIRDRSSDRWLRKREQVTAFVERAFSRLSQPGDFIVTLNDSEFLAVQPSVSRTTALGISANILKETLAFFLGAAAREDLRLFQVMSFTNGELNVKPLDAGHILDGGDAEPWTGSGGSEDSVAARDSLAPVSEDLDWVETRRMRLTSPPNLELDLAITPEPTWNVGARVVASFLLRPSMWLTEGALPERAVTCGELTPTLASEVAIGGLNFAADLIKSGVQVALHAPLPWNAITYSTTRYRLLHALRDMPPQVRRFLILEITDLSAGLPQSRLTEQVSMLAPYCRAVLARAPSDAHDVRAWRGCGLSGVTLDCQSFDASDRKGLQRLAIFAQRAAEASVACVGYGLPATNLMLAAWAAGFTHLGGPALSEEVTEPKSVVRLQAADFLINR